MSKYQQKLIKLGIQYFKKEARPKFEKIQKNLSKEILVFFSGSVAYGFCDALSDIKIEYYLPKHFTQKQTNKFQEFFSEDHYYQSVKMADSMISRSKLSLILTDIKEFWKIFNPYQLYEIAHAIAIHDPSNIIEKVHDKIKFYPHDILMKIIRGLWITANDSGLYNADYAIKRNNITEANIFIYRGLEALLRLILILNREYYPYSKWINNGLKTLKNNFNADQYLLKISSGKLENKHQVLSDFIKKIGIYLEQEKILEKKECNENPWENLNKPFFTYNTFRI